MNTIKKPFTRRNFLKSTSLAAPFILPSHIWAAKGDAAPNSRINVAVIGPGKQGKSHVHRLLRNPETQVVGFAEIAQVRTDHTKELIEGHYAKNTPDGKWKGLTVTQDYRELLALKEVDAVLIATPDHWHGEPTILAARAGKHIYCEKPISLTIKEGRAMADAVKKNNVIFQTGSQQRSEYGGKFRRTVEMIRGGAIGKLKKIQVCVGGPPKPCDLPTQPVPAGIDWDAWQGPAPVRGYNKELCPDNVHNHYPRWRAYREYCNGYLADMGAHHFDIAQWAMDTDHTGPLKVIPPKTGEKGLRFIYASGVEVEHGSLPDWRGGCVFYGSEGTIWVDRGPWKSDPAPLIREYKASVELRRPKNHHGDWIACIRNGELPIAHVEAGHRTASVCQLANIGYELRRELDWDPKSESFPKDKEANALVDRKRREKWYRI
ncbi:MAG: Gfo/Idh/MocA family oxidoreductase [Opitutales bacterium]